MFSINNLLLNIFVNLFGILTIMSIEMKPRFRDPIVICLDMLMIVLCMAFPFYKDNGCIFDLRMIPLILEILYGGWAVGLALSLLLFAYRLYIGGLMGFELTVMVSVPVIALAYLARNRYKQYNRLQRTLMTTTLSFLSVAFMTTATYMLMHGLDEEQWFLFLVDGAIYILTMWIGVFLIETIRENKQMRREVVRMEKLHVLGELAASIAHEIRNPMTVTRGFVQLLSEYVPANKKHYINVSLAELNRAESIINDYLSYAKPQIEHTELLDVEEQLRHTVNVMHSYSTLNNVEVTLHISEPLRIRADSKKLTQVLMNLTKNGIEAMPNGGTLHLRSYRQNQFAVIEVIDTGVGMSPAAIRRLGNPFYSTKEKGTGLGLMVSYRIVEAMQGKIHVTSTENKGTRFTLYFPLV